MNFEQIKSALETAVSSQQIYNADLQALKSWINRLVNEESNAIAQSVWADVNSGVRAETARDAAWDFSVMYIHEIPGKLKKLQQSTIPEPEVLAQYKSLYDRWFPIYELLEQVQPFVIKGRKPSTSPRTTQARTLENTGTCSVCSRNCKLNGGLIVHHGFVVRGARIGSCYGVNYQPWEVSPDGAIAYLALNKEWLVNVEKYHTNLLTGAVEQLTYLKKTVTRKDEAWGKALKAAISVSSLEIQSLKNTIRIFEEKIAAWKPHPLPSSNSQTGKN